MPRYFLLRWVTAIMLVALLAACSSSMFADEQPLPRDDQAPTTRIALSPAAEPSPPLRYRLLPSLIDLRPGNAAVFYNKAALMHSQGDDRRKASQKVDEWLDTPLDRLPLGEVEGYIASWQSVLGELLLASLREECDWQTPVREQTPYTILLPEQQELRALARLVAVKVRLEIAQGKIDDALASLAIGYAMARHAARGPTLIQALVGMAIANLMTHQAREISQRPDGPNLYWAYKSLPRPFVNLDRANEFEFDMLYFWHPEWRDRHRKVLSAAQWQHMWESLAAGMGEFDSEWSGDAGQLRIVGRAVSRYAPAKRRLIENGRSQDEVDAMPVAQVMMLYTLDTFDQLRDEQFKWFGLPYWQISDRLQKQNEALRQASEELEIVPLARTILPAISNVMLSQGRSDRTFCLARIVEALRLYAAGHGGRLPEKLGDLTEVPIPLDPLTGGEFVYRRSGATAIVETPSSPGLAQRSYGMRYEITVRQ